MEDAGHFVRVKNLSMQVLKEPEAMVVSGNPYVEVLQDCVPWSQHFLIIPSTHVESDCQPHLQAKDNRPGRNVASVSATKTSLATLSTHGD